MLVSRLFCLKISELFDVKKGSIILKDSERKIILVVLTMTEQ